MNTTSDETKKDEKKEAELAAKEEAKRKAEEAQKAREAEEQAKKELAAKEEAKRKAEEAQKAKEAEEQAKKEAELAAKEEAEKQAKKEPIEYPNIVERFREVFQKLGIKKSEAYVDHCAKGDLEDLEDIEKKLYEMGLHPSLRNQVINFWASEIKRPVPKNLQRRLAEERGAKSREENGGKEEAEKYSVDTDSGAIKVASTSDKRALTWDEAEKLSKEIKKGIEAREDSKKEPSFVVGDEGKWTLNPKGKVGFGEFAVFQMYQESLKRGEPIDPVEELARREESSARLKEAMGAKGGDTEMTVIDKLQKLGILKTGEGDLTSVLGQLDTLGLLRKAGDEGGGTEMTVIDKLQKLGILKTGEGDLTDVLGRLDTLGLLRKVGDEGKGTELDILDKLSSLGMLAKPGEAEGIAGQTMRALEDEIKSLRESLTKQEMDVIKGSLVSLSRSLEDLRKEMATSGRLEGRYALMEKTITTIDGQLSGLRGDAKPLLEMVAGSASPGPRKKSPEDRAIIAKGVKEAVALEREARELEDELLSSGRQS